MIKHCHLSVAYVSSNAQIINDNVKCLYMCGVGVKREGEKERKEGAVDVEYNSTSSPYLTQNLTYTPEDFQKLINLTSYNILNNKDVILNALKTVLNRNSQVKEAAVGKIISASKPKTRSHKGRKNKVR